MTNRIAALQKQRRISQAELAVRVPEQLTVFWICCLHAIGMLLGVKLLRWRYGRQL